MTTLQRYAETTYFEPLDGLRAVSVLLVLSFHMGDALWQPVHGYLGVTMFFVISGFLITTLLVREESRLGHVRLRAFYVRRAFRILPLYFLALAVFTVLVIAGLGSDRDAYLERLPLLVTLNGEFAGAGTFGHSWSLGIEEKFYIVWPLLFFVALRASRFRLPVATGLLVVTALSSLSPETAYFAIYTPIIAGCVIALGLAHEAVARTLVPLSNPIVAAVLFIGLGVAFMTNDETTYVHVGVGLLSAALVPMVVLRHAALERILTVGPLLWLGRRSYAFYLFHPLVVNATDRVLPMNNDLVSSIVRFAFAAAGSALLAEIAHRFVEKPLIRIGRRLTASSPHRPHTEPLGKTS